MSAALEWLAFGSSMLCVFCYGHSKMQGAVVGIATALLFITWGLVAGVWAAAITNLFFFGLHGRNLWRATKDAAHIHVASTSEPETLHPLASRRH